MGCVPLADAAGIFAQRYVTHVEQPVLDPPMASPDRKQAFGIGPGAWHTGHRILRLVATLAVAPHDAVNAADLGQAGPIVVARQSRAGLKMTMFSSAVALAAAAGFRELSLPLLFGVGGKSPPGTRPRWRL